MTDPVIRLGWLQASPFSAYTDDTLTLLRELARDLPAAEAHLARYEKWCHDNVRRRPATPFQLVEVLRAYRHFVTGRWPAPGRRLRHQGSASIVVIGSGASGLSLFDTVRREAFGAAVRELARTNPSAVTALDGLRWPRDAQGRMEYETDDPEGVAAAVAALSDILFTRLTAK